MKAYLKLISGSATYDGDDFTTFDDDCTELKKKTARGDKTRTHQLVITSPAAELRSIVVSNNSSHDCGNWPPANQEGRVRVATFTRTVADGLKVKLRDRPEKKGGSSGTKPSKNPRTKTMNKKDNQGRSVGMLISKGSYRLSVRVA